MLFVLLFIIVVYVVYFTMIKRIVNQRSGTEQLLEL